MQQGPRSHRRLLRDVLTGILLGCGLLSPGVAQAQETHGWIELTIPLAQGRWYSARQVREEYCRKLGTPDATLSTVDNRRELIGVERGMLHLAHQAGLADVRFETDRLVLRVPDVEDPDVRLTNRRRLEQWLGLELSEWPPGLGLHLSTPFDPQRRTVLLVHGLGAGRQDLARLAAACQAVGMQTIFFDYPHQGPLAWSGDRLRTELQSFRQRHPSTRLAIIAHSMGGLVVRHCLESSDADVDCVTDVVFLGTPQRGSALAYGTDRLRALEGLQHLLVFDTGLKSLQHGLGEAGGDLLPDSAFLRTLNGHARPVGVRYHVAIGTRSFLSGEQSRILSRELQERVLPLDLNPSLRAELQHLINAPEWNTGQGDGAVSVASAHLPQADSERTFALNHLELKDLPGEKPEKSELFQWICQILNDSKVIARE